MDSRQSRIVKLAASLSFCLLTIGCGGNSAGGNAAGGNNPTPSPTPSPTPTTLFADDFAGSFPASNWIIVSGLPTIDASIGNPAPSLEFPLSQSGNCTGGRIQSAVNPFSAAAGLTVSFDIGFPSGTPAFTVVEISDENSNAFRAQLNLGLASGGGINSVNYFFITPTNGQKSVIQPINPDNTFHTYSLVFDAAGNAVWLRDGIQQASTSNFSSNALVLIFCGGDGSGPTFLDNVKVQTP